MNAMVPATAMPLQDMQILARAIAASGLFGIKTPDAALVLMCIAQAEGRHPVEAARDYDIINGKPAKKAEAMMRDFILAGGKCEWHSLTDELADATFTHPQTGKVRISWDMKRAMTAFGKKDMYTKFPRQMLRSRVVSEGVRTLWPLATSGMYVESEVAAMEQHNGTTIEAEPDAREALNEAVPLSRKQQRLRGVDATGKPWRSAEGDDADRVEAAERAAAADMPRAPKVADPTVYETPPKSTPVENGRKPQRGYRDILSSLRIALRAAQTAEEVDRIVCAEEILQAKETFKDDALVELTDVIQAALKRWWHEPPADGLPEVHIQGEELAAG